MVDACGTTTYPYVPGDRDRDSQGSTPLRDFDRGAKFLLTGFNGFQRVFAPVDSLALLLRSLQATQQRHQGHLRPVRRLSYNGIDA